MFMRIKIVNGKLSACKGETRWSAVSAVGLIRLPKKLPSCHSEPFAVILRSRRRSRSLRSGQALSETKEGSRIASKILRVRFFAEFTLSDQSEILRFAQDDSEGFRMTAWRRFSATY
jgi:hypothetical protein